MDNVSSLVIRLKRDFDKEIISEKQYYSTLKKYKRITLHLRKELANKDKKYGKELEYRRKRKPPMGRGRESYSRRRPNKEKKEESEYHWDRLP